MQDGGKVVCTQAMNMCELRWGVTPLIPKLHKLELSGQLHRPISLPPD